MFALILQPSSICKKAGDTPTSDLLLVVSNCRGKSHTGFGAKFFKMRAKLHIPILQYTLLNFLRSRSIYSITQPTKAQKRRHRSGSKQNLAPPSKLDVHLGSRPAWAPVFGSCRLSLSRARQARLHTKGFSTHSRTCLGEVPGATNAHTKGLGLRA